MSSYKHIKNIAPEFHDRVLNGDEDYVKSKANELLKQCDNDVTELGNMLSIITVIENEHPLNDNIRKCGGVIVTMLLNNGLSIREISKYITLLPRDVK